MFEAKCPFLLTNLESSPTHFPVLLCSLISPGADPGFQVRGGALKKIAPSGGRRVNFCGISCEKSRFYDKKIIFFPIAEGSAKFFWVFRVKNHDLTPKNHIFSNFLYLKRTPTSRSPQKALCRLTTNIEAAQMQINVVKVIALTITLLVWSGRDDFENNNLSL